MFINHRLTMSKFERIATFVRVFEEGSFAACAKLLKISSAAVSKQVSMLEEELGFTLLYRSTRKLSLTDAGAIYFEKAKKIVEEMAQMEMLAEEMQQEPFGRLKVAAQHHFAHMHIIPRLKDFLATYPKISLTIELLERFPDLEREDIDIVIGMSRPISLHSIQKTISRTRYVFAASPGYLKEFGIPKVPDDLRKHRYINHTLRTPVHITRFSDNEELFIEPYLLLNDTMAMKNCAVAGIGIVKLHHYAVAKELKEGTLVEILGDYNEPEQPIYASYSPHKIVPSKIRAFLDFFV